MALILLSLTKYIYQIRDILHFWKVWPFEKQFLMLAIFNYASEREKCFVLCSTAGEVKTWEILFMGIALQIIIYIKVWSDKRHEDKAWNKKILWRLLLEDW